MTTFGATIAALGSGIPGGETGALLTIAPDLTDLLAGLGALVVCTIGVMVVRHLKDMERRPITPTLTPKPERDGIRRAA